MARRGNNKSGEVAFYLLIFVVIVYILIKYWVYALAILIILVMIFAIVKVNTPRKDEDTKSVKEPFSEKIVREFAQKQSQYKYTQENKPKYEQGQQTLKEKGAVYEKFVATKYRDLGYDVIEHGLIHGRKDQGIDIIASRGSVILLIQCKNWKTNSKYKITHSHIKEFVGNVAIFMEKNKELSSNNIKRVFITSEDVFDKSAKGYLKANVGAIEHIVIEAPRERTFE